MVMPKYAVLYSTATKKYMRVEDDGRICFDGDTVHNPFGKIEFEKAKSSLDGEYYHIRCCSNNKYWMRKSVESSKTVMIIVAEAEKPEEDLDKDDGDASTLFLVGEARSPLYEFQHPKTNLNLFVRLRNDSLYVQISERLEYVKQDNLCYFHMYDWDLLCVLPRYVSFKGDNGKYLCAFKDRSDHCVYNQFLADDCYDVGSHYELFTNPDGSVSIKSTKYDTFCDIESFTVTGDGWVLADSIRHKMDNDFWPVRLGDNKIVFGDHGIVRVNRRKGPCRYYYRQPKQDNKKDCLMGYKHLISKEAIMEVEELVLRREIYNVTYHHTKARRFGMNVLKKQTLSSENQASRDITDTLKFSYKETTTQSWSSTASMKLVDEVTITAGVPEIGLVAVKASIKISSEFQRSYTWGKTEEVSREATFEHQVTVPPNTKVTADLMVVEARCDVPFSYTQRDLLYNGNIAIIQEVDGLFTGVNILDVKVVTMEEPIKVETREEPIKVETREEPIN